MKVALLNDQLNAGGAEKVLVNMANLMHKKGIEVSVILFMSAAALDGHLHPGIPVHYLRRKSKWNIGSMLLLKKLVNTMDIVHVHSRYNLRYFMTAKFAVGIWQPKVVFHEHLPEYASIDRITAWLLKQVDAYIAVLKPICNWAIVTAKVHADRVFYLPNIVSAPKNLPAALPSSQHTKVMMTGNFRRVKNHLFAIQLVEELGANYSLDLYGMLEDQHYFNELARYISGNNLSHRINIITGVSNLYDAIPNYHFALHTATLETGPLVLLEYMHAGLPFLTYDTGDVASVLKTKVPEVVINSFSIADWKQRIVDVIENHTIRIEVGTGLTNVLNDYYTEEKYWDRLYSVYSKVMAIKEKPHLQPVTQ